MTFGSGLPKMLGVVGALLAGIGLATVLPSPAQARGFVSFGIGVPLLPGPSYYYPPPPLFASPPAPAYYAPAPASYPPEPVYAPPPPMSSGPRPPLCGVTPAQGGRGTPRGRFPAGRAAPRAGAGGPPPSGPARGRSRPAPAAADLGKAAGRGGALHRVPAPCPRDTDRLRRRTGGRAAHAGRRAARRSGGSRRPPLRRPGRAAPRPPPRRRRPRPPQALRHPCGQAFQVDTARQAAHPRQAQCAGDTGVQALARGRDRCGEAQGAGLPRRDGGAGAARAVLPRLARPRPARSFCAGALSPPDPASPRAAARMRRGARSIDRPLHR